MVIQAGIAYLVSKFTLFMYLHFTIGLLNYFVHWLHVAYIFVTVFSGSRDRSRSKATVFTLCVVSMFSYWCHNRIIWWVQRTMH